jgi:hypothetical protein
MNNNLTPLELEALKAITYSDFYENGRESIVWDFSAFDNCAFTGKTRSGVFSSLSQKGIISVTEKSKQFVMIDGVKTRNKWYSKDDCGTIRITEEGYTFLDSLNLIDEDGRFVK